MQCKQHTHVYHSCQPVITVHQSLPNRSERKNMLVRQLYLDSKITLLGNFCIFKALVH